MKDREAKLKQKLEVETNLMKLESIEHKLARVQ